MKETATKKLTTGLITAFFAALAFFGCSSRDFEDDYYSTYTFCEENPETNEGTKSTTRGYKIGSTVSQAELPSVNDSDIKSMKRGYKVSGWKFCKNPLDGSTDIPSNMTTDGNGNITSVTVTPQNAVLYASSWNPVSYTIQFDGNGAESGAMETQAQEYDAASELRANEYERYGYEFANWNTAADGSGASYEDGETVQNLTDTDGGTITLYAQWKKISYDVTLHSNYEPDYTVTSLVYFGESLTLGGIFYRPGYAFTGWNTAADGSGTPYSESDSITPTDNSTELYAQWQAETYTLTYDANGGSGAPSTQTFSYGEAVTVSTAAPTKEGYIFDHWESGGVSYNSGDTFIGTGSVALEAVWRPRATVTSTGGYNVEIEYTFTETGITFKSSESGKWQCDDNYLNMVSFLQIPTTTVSIKYSDYEVGEHVIIVRSTNFVGFVSFTIE